MSEIVNEITTPEIDGLRFALQREEQAHQDLAARFVALEQRLAEAERELAKYKKIYDCAQSLYAESEEYEFDEGMGRGCQQIFWDELGDCFEIIVAPQQEPKHEIDPQTKGYVDLIMGKKP